MVMSALLAGPVKTVEIFEDFLMSAIFESYFGLLISDKTPSQISHL